MQGSLTTSVRVCFWASSLSLLACKSNDRPIVLVEVLDNTEKVIAFDKGPLEQRAVGTVEQLDGYAFRNARPRENGWQYTFDVQLLTQRTSDDDIKNKKRAVGVHVRLKELGGSGEFETSTLETVTEPASQSISGLLDRAIDESAARLSRLMKLQEATDAQLAEAVKKAGPIRNEAVLMAGRRKLGAAVPALIGILEDEEADDDLVLKTIGALVEIGDPKAAGAIIDSARRRSPAYMMQVIFAVSTLGGLEAEAYLFTVKSGHQDPRIRAAAEQALVELERRRTGKK